MKFLVAIVLVVLTLGTNAQNVGIGLTNPSANLHVDSILKIGKNSSISAVTPNRLNALRFGDGNFTSISEEIRDDQLNIRVGMLLIKQSSGLYGNGILGIDVDSAVAALDVNGSLRFRSAGAPGLGKVLTSDATGYATWQTAASGLILPYSTTFSGINTDAMQITNSGTTGNVAFFYNSNTANNYPVIYTISTATSGFGIGIRSRAVSTNTNYENIAISGEIDGANTKGIAVKGYAKNATAIFGETEAGYGVYGQTLTGIGIFGQATGTDGLAGRFVGRSGAVPLELFNQAGGDIAYFRASSALTNKARIDGTGKGFFNGGTQSSGADVAEAFAVEGIPTEYEPGDVLVISTQSDRTVTKSMEPYSALVVGVYATKPGVLLTERMEHESQADLVPMGVIGVIPTKVCSEGGVIRRGDLLVTASTPGHAMKGNKNKIEIGTVIGKALEDFTAGGTGLIKVLVNVR